MDADAFMLYDIFIRIVSVLKSNYLAKTTSKFLMSNGSIINHYADAIDLYEVFNDSIVKLGT